jgi:hypothetical protein
VDALVVLALVLAVLIPLVMIGGAAWFVLWYLQRKIRRDLARDRPKP